MEAGYGQSPTVNEVMTPQEWASLSVESRHKLNVYFLEADKPAASPDALRVALEEFACNWRLYLLAEREYFSKMDELETINNHEAVARAWCRGTAHVEDNLGRITKLLALASSSGAEVQVTAEQLRDAVVPSFQKAMLGEEPADWIPAAVSRLNAALSRQSQPPDPPCPHGHPERGLTCGPECAPPLSKSVEKGRERTCNFTTTSDGDWCTVHHRNGDVCRAEAPRRAAEERKEK